jgi:hypothetical protein
MLGILSFCKTVSLGVFCKAALINLKLISEENGMNDNYFLKSVNIQSVNQLIIDKRLLISHRIFVPI